MSRLPNRFDLFVRRARECADPARQVDYVLGAMAALPAWYFLNVGTQEKPEPAAGEHNSEPIILVFTDGERANELVGNRKELSVLSIPQPAAIEWCVKLHHGLLVNGGGGESCIIPWAQLEAFHTEWLQRGAGQASGFWIPNLTTAEEDFWQEHGL